MKTTLITLAAISAAFAVHAERLILKYPATVNIVDGSGKRIGSKRLKAGTEITISESGAATESSAPKRAASRHGKPSGISPAQFIAERITRNTKFVAVGTLNPDPYFFDDKRLSTKTHWSANLGIYGKNRQQHHSVWGHAMKSSEAGKDLYRILKDGEQHKLLVTIRCFVNTKQPDEVEITEIVELADDDPLITSLMDTP